MANKLKITFIDIPNVNDTIGFYFTNLATPFLRENVFKSVRVNPSEVTIGADVNECALNYYNAFIIDYGTYFNVTISSNIVEISANNLSNIYDEYITNSGDVYVTFGSLAEQNIILSRSPYNVSITPGVLFDNASLNLKVYRGTQTTDSPATTTFPLSKSVIQAGQTKVRFEISKLINDYTKSNIPVFGIGLKTSTSYDSIWIDAEIIAYYLGESIGTETRQYLALDGFGWHTELYNPQLQTNVLSSIITHIVYKDSDYPIYFRSKDLVSITVDGDDVPFTLDDTVNNQAVAYVNMKGYINTQESFTAVFEYSTVTETHTIIVKDSCKYPLYNCFFKNKYGFWQSIPFNLRSKTTINVESNEYNPVVSFFGEYSLASHNTKTYIPSAKDVISCNTDYIPEEYNVLFDELLLSEFVYLETGGVYLPVNVNKNSLDKKTRKFDKLIQYTMDFKYSFNKMNNVI